MAYRQLEGPQWGKVCFGDLGIGPAPAMEGEGTGTSCGRFHRYGVSFEKSHSASSLSMISNAAPREDNGIGGPGHGQVPGPGQQLVGSCSLSSSSSSSETEAEPRLSTPANPGGASDASRMKSSFINVFSLKSKIGTDAGGTRAVGDPLVGSAQVIPPVVLPPKETSSPNIFKKIISRKALIPRMKAFKRIANDMQMESYPLDDEMQHEMIITTAMKEDDELSNSRSSYSFLLSQKNSPRNILNQDNLKKFEVINKANESWNNNRRKSSSSLTNSESYKSNSRQGSMSNASINLHKRKTSVTSLIPTGTNISASTTVADASTAREEGGDTPYHLLHGTFDTSSHSLLSNPFETIRKSRKRKAKTYDDCYTDVEEYLSDDGGVSPWNPMMNCKRRLVSGSVTNSPKSPALDAYPSRRNSIMMQSLQSASDDFEQMSLK